MAAGLDRREFLEEQAVHELLVWALNHPDNPMKGEDRDDRLADLSALDNAQVVDKIKATVTPADIRDALSPSKAANLINAEIGEIW